MEYCNSARLHRNVQFIYERSLAKEELRSFGLSDFDSHDFDPWEFRFNGAADINQLLERSAYFASVNGRESIYKQLILPEYQGGHYNITRSVNQYLTHWIYPYKGKFHPQMIRALLNILHVGRDHVVLDPFLGSGTTAIECMLMGIDFVGIDISPLCVLIAAVKTQGWRAADEIAPLVESERQPGKETSKIIHDFFELARLVTESDVSVRRKDRGTAYAKNIRKMLKSIRNMALAKERFQLNFGKVSVAEGDSKDMRSLGIEDSSIDAIITSPPYSIALDYVKNDAHALEAMGLDLNEIRHTFIGVRGRHKERMPLYNEDMRIVFQEMARVLKPGGHAAVVIGNATYQEEITTTEEMKTWGEPHGLVYYREMPKIVFGLYSVITDEKILFFRKEG